MEEGEGCGEACECGKENSLYRKRGGNRDPRSGIRCLKKKKKKKTTIGKRREERAKDIHTARTNEGDKQGKRELRQPFESNRLSGGELEGEKRVSD